MEFVIALDAYDDIFSDFDIRSYRDRALSKDFLDELRLRLRKAGTIVTHDVVLLMPARDRNGDDELLIIERMRAFFAERRATNARRKRKAKLDSLLFVATGLAFSLGANLLASRFAFLPLFNEFLLIPAWFFVWNGLELFLKNRAEYAVKERYYAALSEARIGFRDREAY